MNSTEIFAIALGLSSPWEVKKIVFENTPSNSMKELHIYLDFDRGFKFSTPEGNQVSAYDSTERVWQHLNFFQHKCYLHARVPRIKHSDNKISTVSVPWARENSGFTLMFEAYSMLLIESEMPVSKVAHCVGCTSPRIWRVFDYWISKAISKDDLSGVCHIGIDETSSKKGHKYITQVVDLDARRTIFVTEGKDSETVTSFVTTLENKAGDRNNITIASMDMSPAFIGGVITNFKNAQIVFDKFHLVQSLNKALDEVRILERKGNELLKGHKYTFLRKYDKLKLKHKEELHHLLLKYPVLGEAYRLRELFMDMYTIKNPEEAKGYLSFWCDMAQDAGIKPFSKFVNMIKSHWSGITAYFDTRVTNGVLEGINCKIQLAKRRARGYRNIHNFINMIHFLTGKLKFDYPHYSL